MDTMAEGFGRGSNKEFVQFLYISKASCIKVMSQPYRAKDSTCLNNNEFDALCKQMSQQV
ncbi:four helix bundle protein [Catalinimonas alkaloidigena]|nr:four helix bundle protein [Catalinimonas alkaloidigena]